MSENQSNKGGRTQWPPYHWLESPEIKPIVDEFWKEKYDESDLAMYNRFLEILRLSRSGLNGDEIGRTLQMNNVRKFVTGKKMSFLTHLRAEHDRLGPPINAHKWLPLRLKPRGTPDDSWIDVPHSPLNFADIKGLIERLTPSPIEPRVLSDFGFSSPEELQRERTNLFGFLLGATVGDSGKGLKATAKFSSRRFSLVLSTNKPNSLRFGEFTTLCENASLGLGMHRMNDLPISDKRFGKSECYAWYSPSSPFFAWIFNECLGLKDGETTTRDPIRSDWLLDSPRDFQVHFIQGLSESDGWPSAGDDKVRVVSSPNTPLFKKMLEGLGCQAQIEQQEVELLRCCTEDAMKLPFFSPRINSNLYQDTQVLANAKRYPERLRLPQATIDLIRELRKTTDNANEICLRLAKTIGYKVSAGTVRKYSES